ncbi:zinc-binding dehydrogenase [Vitiosangium sp. GDMCC 1.1324]|uniref:zinc-binding dehydrogenase n=1 Tax=Vitiosangium sp. (strain GDMCC 1.1324) TaxID=2138576 RepID=UPI001E3749CD|nr:zinc-binding dehydrogenase [Vitiosangium sp. GDMCC 1.1324]
MNRLLFKKVDVVGVAWGAFVMQEPQLTAEIAKALATLADKGFVEPVVGPVFPLEQVAQALRELDSRKATGKVVLRVREG